MYPLMYLHIDESLTEYICIVYIHIYLFIQFLECKQLVFFLSYKLKNCFLFSVHNFCVPSSASAEQGEMIMSW